MDKKQIQLAVLIGVVVIVLVVLFYQGVFSSRAGAPSATGGAPVDYRSQLMKVEMMVKNLPQQRQEVVQFKEKVKTYSAEMPLEQDHTWLSRQINQAAAEAGMGDVSQRYQPSVPSDLKLEGELKEHYAERIWEIRMRCGYHELGHFLDRLEAANKFFSVKDINIEGNDPAGQKVTLVVRYLVKKGDGIEKRP